VKLWVKIVLWVIAVLCFIILVVPYCIPVAYHFPVITPQSMAAPGGKFITVDKAVIYVEESGPLNTENTILFLHGMGGSIYSWRENTPFFADRGFRVIAMDMKGFGLSSKDFATDYSHPAQARLVAAVLDELGVNRVFLVGHSMGTSVMFHFAHLYPERVRAMLSVDGALRLEGSNSLLNALLQFPPLVRAGRVVLTHYVTRDRLISILKSAYYRPDIITFEVEENYYQRALIGSWDEALLAMTRDMNSNIIDFPLESISAPVLILWGENDSWVTLSSIQIWKDRLPNAQLIIVPAAGHLPMEETPELFNHELLEFISANSEI
jgi:pimeloyl-ACP methyl ester carboxylesterase